MERCDVAIVGAGPYGLSAAAHLRGLKGLDVRLLGEPMSFWDRHMPKGMLLRSPWVASHIADPSQQLTLDAYRRVNGNRQLAYPVPVRDFINYGNWFHRQVAVPADRRKVTRIDLAPGGYRLSFERGEELLAGRVVVAGGIQPFAHRPEIFEGLPTSLVTHTSERVDYSEFRDKETLVIGAGQSALEAGAFLHKAGARVEVLIRNSTVHWLGHRAWMHKKPISWFFYGRADVGPAGISMVVQRPNLFRRLPRRIQKWWGTRAIRPAVSHRLAACAEYLPMRTGLFPVQARVEGDRLRVRLNDGTERSVDHVVLGTGYRVNIALYPFLSSEVLERIERINGFPRLDAGFECSLPGLHFLGAPAAWSFGPLMRFVAGTEFVSPALARRIRRKALGRRFYGVYDLTQSQGTLREGPSNPLP
jgi:FAD-dependent urate hydroxylase